MGVVDPIKCPSFASLTCSEDFRFNPNYIHRSHPMIISYLHLAESSTGHPKVTIFVALSAYM